MLYGGGAAAASAELAAGDSAGAIEDEINAEVAELHQPAAGQLFTPIRVDVQCGRWRWIRAFDTRANQSAVVFFKTVSPVEPVSFVKRICEDAMQNPDHKRTRFAKRLSPVTLMGRASADGLEKVAEAVLQPHFHATPHQPRKVGLSLLPETS